MLYFVKNKIKMALAKCKNFAVLLCFYVNTFILLYFLRRGYSPPIHPPKSATVIAQCIMMLSAGMHEVLIL